MFFKSWGDMNVFFIGYKCFCVFNKKLFRMNCVFIFSFVFKKVVLSLCIVFWWFDVLNMCFFFFLFNMVVSNYYGYFLGG